MHSALFPWKSVAVYVTLMFSVTGSLMSSSAAIMSMPVLSDGLMIISASVVNFGTLFISSQLVNIGSSVSI